jgi:hypothetical protein
LNATVESIHQGREQTMNTYERTWPAAAVCLALVVSGLWLFDTNFEWPTGRLGRPPTQREIWVDDILPIIVAGYGIGLSAIAITRFFFPRSDIKTILYVVAGGAVLISGPLLMLSAAISGTPTDRDFGSILEIFAAPLAIASWAVIASYRPKREAR